MSTGSSMHGWIGGWVVRDMINPRESEKYMEEPIKIMITAIQNKFYPF